MTDLGGRYRLEASIGRGGTGEVMRARDLRLDRVVAVKMLHPWVATDEEARRRFRREATTLAQLRHPNVVQVLDFDDALPTPFLVQEHCGGGTLVRRAQEAPLPWPEVAAIGLAVARGLAHAHAAGVTHRDLKPGNVLYGDDGQLRVADFGLADVLRREGDDTLTMDGARVGSPEYWAPEQAAGRQVTERADMYALGCILYELATGSLPFEGSDRVAVGMRRIQEDPPPPTAFAPDLPPEASALIMELLQRAPERRPRAEDVVRILSGEIAIETEQHDERATTRIDIDEIPPTMVAPAPEPARPGVRTGGLRFGAVLLALGIVAAGLGIAAGARVERAGIVADHPLGRVAAAAALLIAGGAIAVCLGLACIALWAGRNRHRAQTSTGRVALAVLAVPCAALASATIVWTANAWVTAGVAALWGKLQ